MRFSQRYGYRPVRQAIQLESMDGALRNALWNLLHVCFWESFRSSDDGAFGRIHSLNDYGNQTLKLLCEALWADYFHKPLDSLSMDWREVHAQIRTYFFGAGLDEVYDFIEFVAERYRDTTTTRDFMDVCNTALEKEMSAYRFIDNHIARITEPVEVEAIESALDSADQPISRHLSRALELLSDRSNPDFRNSIKESISAVERLVAKVTDSKNGTLGKMLNKLDDALELHPTLKDAFNKLYGYTSDESGIRHALKDKAPVDFDDAKFMLVTCSAFINYVEGKLLKDQAA